MLAIQAIILGIIQGLTEFIPISSSAHLIIVPWLFRWTDPALTSLTFDVSLHIGTLIVNWYSNCGHQEKRDKMNELLEVTHDQREKEVYPRV
jgi:undecaprenyl pyrophosphate phosphatase UppP